MKGDNLIVFYYFSPSEIWPDERDGLWLYLQEGAIVFSTDLNISICLFIIFFNTLQNMDINLQRGLNIDCYLMSSEHFK